ncbi:hypothetical protein AB6C98_02770 [Vibrio splendidus]
MTTFISKQHEAQAIACELTSIIYNDEIPVPMFEVAPATWSNVLEAESWPPDYDSKGLKKNMDWQAIYKRQLGKSKRFLCVVRTTHDKKAVGLFAGRDSPNDDDGSRISVDYVQRNLNAPKSKGHLISIALTFAYVMADATNSELVKVNNPVKELLPLYEDEMPEAEFKQRGGKHCYLQAPVIKVPAVQLKAG